MFSHAASAYFSSPFFNVANTLLTRAPASICVATESSNSPGGVGGGRLAALRGVGGGGGGRGPDAALSARRVVNGTGGAGGGRGPELMIGAGAVPFFADTRNVSGSPVP